MTKWKKFFQSIATFGASNRIDNRIYEYEKRYKKFIKIKDLVITKRLHVKTVLEELIYTKKQSWLLLLKLRKISNKFSVKNRSFIETYKEKEINVNLIQINNCVEIGNNYFKGFSLGVSTSAGSFALVSSYGLATTGTAISSLSGAAATNATLAWFGGGSLAAGGGGMAAGTLILGGIVGVVALTGAGIFSHIKAGKKIKEIAEKENDIIKAIDKLKEVELKMDLIEKRANEIISILNKDNTIFIKKFNKKLFSI